MGKVEADKVVDEAVNSGDLSAAQQAKKAEKEMAANMAREIEEMQVAFEEKELECHNTEEQLQITFEEMIANMRKQAGLDERKWRLEMKNRKEAALELEAQRREEALAAEQAALDQAKRERLEAKAKAEALEASARTLDEAGIAEKLKEEEEKARLAEAEEEAAEQ